MGGASSLFSFTCGDALILALGAGKGAQYIKLVIPLAGWGSRLRPQPWTQPKPLIHVPGKPFLGYLLDEFVPLDVEELVVIYGWLGEKIKAYLRTHYSDLGTESVEQAELKG